MQTVVAAGEEEEEGQERNRKEDNRRECEGGAVNDGREGSGAVSGGVGVV